MDNRGNASSGEAAAAANSEARQWHHDETMVMEGREVVMRRGKSKRQSLHL